VGLPPDGKVYQQIFSLAKGIFRALCDHLGRGNVDIEKGKRRYLDFSAKD